jgi:hypothetical protein
MTTDSMTHIGAFIPKPGEQRTADPDAGGVMTKHGWFSKEDLASAQARVITHNGQRVIQFPIRYELTGFADPVTGKPAMEPVYAPVGPEHAKTRQEMAEADAARSRARHEGRSRNG